MYESKGYAVEQSARLLLLILLISLPAPSQNKEGRKEMFYLTTHSTHFIYGYIVSDIW